MPGIKLSPSTLNLFAECPRCFWFAVKKGLGRPKGPFPSLPTGMDSVIKKYFDTYRGKNEMPPILRNKIKGRLALSMPKTLYFEDDSEYVLYGRPDEYVEHSNETISALDHKTRASAPKELLPVYQNQLDIYDFLLSKNGYKTQNKAYLVYYYPEAGQLHNGFPFAVRIKEIETEPGRAEELFRKAVEILEQNEAPEAHEECKYCVWLSDMDKIQKL